MTFINRVLGSEKKYKLQYRALHLLLFSGILLGFIASIINLLTEINIINIILPLVASVFCALLYYYARKGRKPYVAKLTFIIFIDFIYFPLAWLTSYGSLSSMPYYSIMFLVVTFLIIEYQKEYIIPILFLILAIFLMYMEIRWPFLFKVFGSNEQRLISVIIHYAIVVIFLGTIFVILLNKYIDISKGYDRQVIRDELTGLFTRTHGIKQLQVAFEDAYQNDHKYILLIFELHQLKDFNLINGPLAGDELIRSLAAVMIQSSRSNDLCSRYGGNEFFVLLNHTDLSQVDVYLERIYDAYDKLLTKYSKSQLKLLVGKADFDYNDINEVMRAAGQNLEASKKELQGGYNV